MCVVCCCCRAAPQAEAFLAASGVSSVSVKPCGIEGTYGRGGKQMLVGHDDVLHGGSSAGAISREDVAVRLSFFRQRAPAASCGPAMALPHNPGSTSAGRGSPF